MSSSEETTPASTVVTFGEIMLRLSTPGHLRFGQSSQLDCSFGGGEANVALALAQFGMPARLVTRLPDNDLGEACLRQLRGLGVDTSAILRGGERIGIYFLESGSAQRGSKVIYDRDRSAFATIEGVDWKKALEGAAWFHWTGITPAISREAADACREGARAAREMGLTVSCDLNYRKKLWRWGASAGEVMSELVGLCDIAIGNEEDAEKVFGIAAPGVDVTAGKVEASAYREVCQALSERFPSLRSIAITLRGSVSASHNTWSALLFDEGRMIEGPRYDITPIVDRVGGGDSFAAGLILGYRRYPTREDALRFAVAASCLKHTIWGDFNRVTLGEVEALMGGDASGRVSR